MTAAVARDATRLEPLVCFIFILFFILMFFFGPLNLNAVKTAMAAAASESGTGTEARDATRLELLVTSSTSYNVSSSNCTNDQIIFKFKFALALWASY
jgi:hypothetical protein